MRAESHSFKQEDIEHCDTVAELLHELVSRFAPFRQTENWIIAVIAVRLKKQESEVKRFHNELETETIKNSVLRHKISYFDSDLKKEIDGKNRPLTHDMIHV